MGLDSGCVVLSRLDEVGELLSAPAPVVAARLLGWRMTTCDADGTVTVVLTEVEAYHGAEDPASHAYRGTTRRNATMFGPPGRLYVYLSHGLHLCANVVCGQEGTASAVLLRAGRVVSGEEVARRRRERPAVGRAPRTPIATAALARGPGSLGRALGLRAEDDGGSLLSPGGRLLLSPPTGSDVAGTVVTGPRVGVSSAADRPWRHWLRDDPTVSVYRRSPRAPAPGSVPGEGPETQ
jgi:DNA-3-methyladenine glycosylase